MMAYITLVDVQVNASLIESWYNESERRIEEARQMVIGLARSWIHPLRMVCTL
ncbi:unnamed protein product [Eretmochelys imbricata]